MCGKIILFLLLLFFEKIIFRIIHNILLLFMEEIPGAIWNILLPFSEKIWNIFYNEDMLSFNKLWSNHWFSNHMNTVLKRLLIRLLYLPIQSPISFLLQGHTVIEINIAYANIQVTTHGKNPELKFTSGWLLRPTDLPISAGDSCARVSYARGVEHKQKL